MFTPARYKPLGDQQISAATLVAAQTLTVPQGANVAVIRVGSAAASSVNWRDGGGVPTALIGMPMLNTDPPLEYSANLGALQFIAATGSPILNVSYYQVFI